ncbi:unnamed protein product [Urochloa humidicola]
MEGDPTQLFLQWATNMMLQQEQFPDAEMSEEEIIAGADGAVSRWGPVRTHTTDGGGGGRASDPAGMDHDVWPAPPPNSARLAPSGMRSNIPLSFNFSAAFAQPPGSGTGSDGSMPEQLYGPPPAAPTRRAGPKIAGRRPSSSFASYAQDHIIAERKRRETINKRFIELSAVIPGLKKMDKATILADAARYVKDLHEKLNALEANSGTGTVVMVKRPSHADAATKEESSPLEAPASARKQLPEIDAWLSGNTMMMVRILCANGKRVVVRVLAEVEGLHLNIVDANVTPFLASTLIVVTVTAKAKPGFTITVEEVIDRVTSALSQHHI